MHSETDFRPAIHYVIYWQDKRMSTNEQYEEPSKHIVSIGNHEKGMKNAFSAPSQWNEMCFVHQRIIFEGKKGQNFHICLRSGWGPLPLPYGQPDRKIPVFYGFPSGCLLYYVLANNKRETKRACWQNFGCLAQKTGPRQRREVEWEFIVGREGWSLPAVDKHFCFR